nr:MAG TPA: hypothetical protein [Crassvirales sp.]
MCRDSFLKLILREQVTNSCANRMDSIVECTKYFLV